ncbi:MAG: hypothetical protein WCD79_16015 [Chthoniobacteraceae bacterium]
MATIKDGLVRWRNNAAELIPKEGGLVEPRALAGDAAGRLWVGTEGGRVFLRRNDQFVPVPLPGAKPGEQIRFIVPDEKDTVWIGVFNGGLYRRRAGQVAQLPHDAGLPVDDLRVLAIEPGGISGSARDAAFFALRAVRLMRPSTDAGSRCTPSRTVATMACQC